MVTTAKRHAQDLERDEEFIGLWDGYCFWRHPMPWRPDTGRGRAARSDPRVVERARWIKTVEISYIRHDDFDRPEARRELLSASPRSTSRKSSLPVPRDVSSYVASLYRTPLLGRDEEVALFRRMNGLKHLARRLQEQIDPDSPDVGDLEQFEWLMDEACQVRNRIIEANLRLVFSLAKRFAGNDRDEFSECVAEGNIALMRAVELFDFSRGNRFSTYAHHAIRRQLLQRVQSESRRRERFVSGVEEAAAEMDRDDGRAIRDDQRIQDARQAVRDLLPCLTDRERAVIEVRFGLDSRQKPQTFQEIARRMGVSKERIRQLQVRALQKMARSASESSAVEAWEEAI